MSLLSTGTSAECLRDAGLLGMVTLSFNHSALNLVFMSAKTHVRDLHASKLK